MKSIKESGFSIIELIVAIGIMGIIALGVTSFMEKTDKEVKISTEDIQNKILALGAEKLIRNDLSNVFVSYNYINLQDDFDMWFYAFNRSFECLEPSCKREVTLEIAQGQTTSSKEFYALILSAKPKEKLSFNIDPENVFKSTTPFQYQFINYQGFLDQDYDISKEFVPDSPWDAGRLLLLTSKVRMLDCVNGVRIPTRAGCLLSCSGGALCNAPVKRKFKMLGIVSANKKELEYKAVSGMPNFFKTNMKPCRLGSGANDNTCVNNTSLVTLNEPKKFFENLPYFPGYDNGTHLQPVELIRYRLEKINASQPAKFTRLIRESATLQAGHLRFTKKFTVLVGVQNVVFTRKNVSNPTITFKVNRVSRYNNN